MLYEYPVYHIIDSINNITIGFIKKTEQSKCITQLNAVTKLNCKLKTNLLIFTY